MTGPARLLRGSVVALAVLATAGCVRGCPSSRPPIHLNPNMDDTPRYDAQEASGFFYDGKTMRAPVPGTVARGHLVLDPRVHTGKDDAGNFLTELPLAETDALLDRGRARYAIYCQPCHDKRGDGRGILFQRGGVPTTSMHDERVRGLAAGELFDVITHGKGLMPSYGYPIPPEDRWAIITWVRHLQHDRTGSAVADARSR